MAVTVSFACGQCGADYSAPEHLIGTWITCMKCGRQLRVPRPPTLAADTGPAWAEELSAEPVPGPIKAARSRAPIILCESCGARNRLSPAKVGKQLRCHCCGTRLRSAAERGEEEPSAPPRADERYPLDERPVAEGTKFEVGGPAAQPAPQTIPERALEYGLEPAADQFGSPVAPRGEGAAPRRHGRHGKRNRTRRKVGLRRTYVVPACVAVAASLVFSIVELALRYGPDAVEYLANAQIELPNGSNGDAWSTEPVDPKYEALFKELLALVNETNDVLSSIRDEASNRAALPKLFSLASRWEDIRARLDTFDSMPASEDRRLFAKYGATAIAGMERFEREARRLKRAPWFQREQRAGSPFRSLPGMTGGEDRFESMRAMMQQRQREMEEQMRRNRQQLERQRGAVQPGGFQPMGPQPGGPAQRQRFRGPFGRAGR